MSRQWKRRTVFCDFVMSVRREIDLPWRRSRRPCSSSLRTILAADCAETSAGIVKPTFLMRACRRILSDWMDRGFVPAGFHRGGAHGEEPERLVPCNTFRARDQGPHPLATWYAAGWDAAAWVAHAVDSAGGGLQNSLVMLRIVHNIAPDINTFALSSIPPKIHRKKLGLAMI
jgi:hypothetical protein